MLEDSDASIADDEPEHQFKDDNIDSCYSQSEQEEQNSQPEINVLSKEQDLLLKVISNLQDSDQKRYYLEQFKETLDKPSTTSSNIFIKHSQVVKM